MVDEVAVREVDAWIEKAPKEYSNVIMMVRELALEASFDDSENPATYEIMESILSAGTIEDLFQAANAGTTAGKDFVDRPFYWDGNGQYKISSIGLKNKTGFPFYWLGKVTDLQTGERIVLNCGGHTFVPVLWKMGKLGIFDQFGPEGVPMVIKGKVLDESRTVLIPSLYALPNPSKSKTVKGEKVSD